MVLYLSASEKPRRAHTRETTSSLLFWWSSFGVRFFFLEIKPPGSLYGSKREEADEQVRRRFRDPAPVLTIPTLHGVSAFGTRLAFYEYDLANESSPAPRYYRCGPHFTLGF
jgi:hypothetical protein